MNFPDSLSPFLEEEFNNSIFREMSELLNTQMIAAAAKSLWSNEIRGKYNSIINNRMMDKMTEKVGCSMEYTIAWTVNTKNSLKNVYEYSLNQLACEFNPNFTIIENNRPLS